MPWHLNVDTTVCATQSMWNPVRTMMMILYYIVIHNTKWNTIWHVDKHNLRAMSPKMSRLYPPLNNLTFLYFYIRVCCFSIKISQSNPQKLRILPSTISNKFLFYTWNHFFTIFSQLSSKEDFIKKLINLSLTSHGFPLY